MDKSFEAALVEYCAPTLAGMKPANLFFYRSRGCRAVCDSVAGWSKKLEPYGISVRILKECGRGPDFLIYVCREAWLGRILSDRMTRAFLQALGYRFSGGGEDLLAQLSRRLCLEEEFPHEVGVFLGYPLFDVVSFIENGGRNCAFSGYWKAYDNPLGARKRSEQYRKCTVIYKRMFENGTPIQRLIVAA